MKRILGLVLMVVVLISGCGPSTGEKAKKDLSNLSPTEVVEAYYNSIASQDYSTAKNCLSDELVQQYVDSPYSDLNNIKKLTDLKVHPAAPIKLYGKNFAEVQVTAEYVAEYKEEKALVNGKQFMFIYVAQKEKDSPWKIISIGTGP